MPAPDIMRHHDAVGYSLYAPAAREAAIRVAQASSGISPIELTQGVWLLPISQAMRSGRGGAGVRPFGDMFWCLTSAVESLACRASTAARGVPGGGDLRRRRHSGSRCMARRQPLPGAGQHRAVDAGQAGQRPVAVQPGSARARREPRGCVRLVRRRRAVPAPQHRRVGTGSRELAESMAKQDRTLPAPPRRPGTCRCLTARQTLTPTCADKTGSPSAPLAPPPHSPDLPVDLVQQLANENLDSFIKKSYYDRDAETRRGPAGISRTSRSARHQDPGTRWRHIVSENQGLWTLATEGPRKKGASMWLRGSARSEEA